MSRPDAAPAPDVVEAALAAAGGRLRGPRGGVATRPRCASPTTPPPPTASRRDRRVTVIASGRGRRGRGGRRRPARRATSTSADLVAGGRGTTPRGLPPAEDAAPLVGGGADAVVRPSPRPHRPLGALGRARRPRRAPSAGPRRRAGCCRGSPSTRWPPPTSGRPPGCGCATSSPPGRSTWWAAAATAPARPGPGPAPPTSPTSPSSALEERGGPRPRLGAPAGRPRGRPLRGGPPARGRGRPHGGPGRGGRAAGRPRRAGRVFSAPVARTRLGEDLSPAPLRAVERPGRPPASSARRSWPPRPRRPTSRSSTTACRSAGSRWIEGGQLGRLRYHRAGRGALAASRSPRRSTTSCSSSPGPTASLDDLVAAHRAGLLLTCLWYIREVDPATLLLTGLTRDGVYVVEDGKVVGRGQQLPLQREPGRPPGPGDRGRGLGAGPGREFGEWVNRTAHAARCGSPTST